MKATIRMDKVNVDGIQQLHNYPLSVAWMSQMRWQGDMSLCNAFPFK